VQMRTPLRPSGTSVTLRFLTVYDPHGTGTEAYTVTYAFDTVNRLLTGQARQSITRQELQPPAH
jgi:hypothetical protein